jgi:hypothetical protein
MNVLALAGTVAAGLRVHISDASPRGFTGLVTAVYPDALRVARDGDGASVLVFPSRRRVTVMDR